MLVEAGAVHRTEAVLVPDHPRQVVARADPHEEVELRLLIHQFVDQVTEALHVTDPGLSLALAGDLGHVQDHEMGEGS